MIISKKDPWRGEYDSGMDGITTISKLKYSIDEKSDNPNDNIFIVNNSRIKTINISTFLTHIPFGSEEYYNYDLREPKRKIINPDKIRETKRTVTSTSDWTNIPYYPTTLEKKENVANYLIKMGKQVPESLLKQIFDGKKKLLENDSYNNFFPSNPYEKDDIKNDELKQNIDNLPNFYHQQQQFNPYQKQQFNPYQQQQFNPYQQRQFNPQQQEIYQPMVQNGHLSKIPHNMANPQQFYRPIPHKFSPEYAAYIGAKPRAQSSARIRLGGAY
jgi:hypothetical protein